MQLSTQEGQAFSEPWTQPASFCEPVLNHFKPPNTSALQTQVLRSRAGLQYKPQCPGTLEGRLPCPTWNICHQPLEKLSFPRRQNL